MSRHPSSALISTPLLPARTSSAPPPFAQPDRRYTLRVAPYMVSDVPEAPKGGGGAELALRIVCGGAAALTSRWAPAADRLAAWSGDHRGGRGGASADGGADDEPPRVRSIRGSVALL